MFNPVIHQFFPMLCNDRFRMELHSANVVFPVAQGHDMSIFRYAENLE